jgi:hypothetical protein
MTQKLELTAEEADGLCALLVGVLEVKKVELHRTEAFAYKDLVKTHIKLLERIIAKLQHVPPPRPDSSC